MQVHVCMCVMLLCSQEPLYFLVCLKTSTIENRISTQVY